MAAATLPAVLTDLGRLVPDSWLRWISDRLGLDPDYTCELLCPVLGCFHEPPPISQELIDRRSEALS